MAESEWAKRMAREFKAGKERKAEEGVKLQEGQTTRKGFASKLWTDVGEAFRQCNGAWAASLSKNPIPSSQNHHGILSPPPTTYDLPDSNTLCFQQHPWT